MEIVFPAVASDRDARVSSSLRIGEHEKDLGLGELFESKKASGDAGLKALGS